MTPHVLYLEDSSSTIDKAIQCGLNEVRIGIQIPAETREFALFRGVKIVFGALSLST
jgi:hypothetical protein